MASREFAIEHDRERHFRDLRRELHLLTNTYLRQKTLPGKVTPAGPLQARVLADGQVTHDEMQEVLDAVVGCFEEEGFDATLEEFRPGRGWSLSVETAKGPEAAQVGARDAYCSGRFLSEVEHVYFDAHRLTPAELNQRSENILQCLIERGNDVHGHSLAEAILHSDLVGFEECEKAVDSNR